MINQKEIKQVAMSSWLLKLLSRGMKKKAKDKYRSTNNYEK